MIELFVENRRIDIDKGFSTLLTLAIDDIKDFGAKNTTFSKTIVLPGTKSNNINFGNIFNPNAGSTYNPNDTNIAYNFNAAIAAKAYIFADNLQIFKGIFRILEIIVDDGFIEYECAVFGELGGFVAKVGNKKLEDLDFSAYNHTYNLTNITNSWNNASGGSSYYYPLIDYGTYSTLKKDWNYRTFRPAFFAKEYIDKIFAASGYTYDCALFSTTRFKSLIVPHNQKNLTRKSSDLLNVYKSPAAWSVTADGIEYKNVLDQKPTLGNFVAQSGDTEFKYNSATVITGLLKVRIRGEVTDTLNFANTRFKIYYGANSNLVGEIQPLISTTFDLALDVNYTTALNDLVYITDQSFETDWVTTSSLNSSIRIDEMSIVFESLGNSLVTININENLVANDTLPKNILQKDFVSSIVKLFNLYVFEDYSNENVLKIQPFVDFYANATAVDWSNKIDRSKPIKIKPMSELNSRYFEFNYKDDSDYFNDLYKKRYNLTYGSMKYDSEFEFANEVTKVDIIFSPTPLVGYTGEDKVYSTIFKQSNGNEETVDSNIRLLLAKKITGVATWHIRDHGGGSLHNATVYPYAGHFDDPDAPSNDLNFGVPQELFFDLASGSINVNQFNVYWGSYLAEITDKDSRLLTATFKLSYKDIYQLNFSKLIWVDGNLYRLNKIEDFNASEPDLCKVELLKIINRIY